MSEKKDYKIVSTRDMRYMVTLGTTEIYTAKTKEDAEFILNMFVQADIEWAEYNDTVEKVRAQKARITELEAEVSDLHTRLTETLQLLSQYRDAYERAILAGSDETTAPDASEQDTQELPALGDIPRYTVKDYIYGYVVYDRVRDRNIFESTDRDVCVIYAKGLEAKNNDG